MLRGDIDLLVWGLLSAPHARITTTSLSLPVYLFLSVWIPSLPFNLKPYCFFFFFVLCFWLCGLVVSMYLFLHFSLSSSVVEGIGIPWGERIVRLWVSAWGCTDSDLMDTAVHNVVYREAMSTAGTSAQYSASPHATQSYPSVSPFTARNQRRHQAKTTSGRRFESPGKNRLPVIF